MSLTSSNKKIECNKAQHSTNCSSSQAHNLPRHFQASPSSPQPNNFFSATVAIFIKDPTKTVSNNCPQPHTLNYYQSTIQLPN